MNQKNSLGLNACFMDLEDPLELFKLWMIEAEKKEISDPNAFSLATVDSKGRPNVRMILLKGYGTEGFVFYTNLNSPKSHELGTNSRAAICFHWKSLQRQVRILGNVKQVNDKEADIYFDSRSYESKIGAWASDQSSTMKKRTELLNRIEDIKKKYNKSVPRPPHWSGWSLNPLSIEFWLHKENRNHERLVYNKITKGWKKNILYP